MVCSEGKALQQEKPASESYPGGAWKSTNETGHHFDEFRLNMMWFFNRIVSLRMLRRACPQTGAIDDSQHKEEDGGERYAKIRLSEHWTEH